MQKKVLVELQDDNEGRDNAGEPYEDATDFDVCIRQETNLSIKESLKLLKKA